MSKLFGMIPISDILHRAQSDVAESIDQVPTDIFLNTPTGTMCDHLEESHKIGTPVLFEDAITSDVCEETVDAGGSRPRVIWELNRELPVRGTKATYQVPFEGNEKAFFWTPTRPHHGLQANVEVEKSRLVISVSRPDHQHQEFLRPLNQTLEAIRMNLGQLREDVKSFNEGLRVKIFELVEARRQKLLKDRALAESLPFPLRKRGDAQPAFSVPMVPKRILSPLAVPGRGFVPEPALAMEHYEQILAVISGMARVIERSPGHFRDIKEEVLRSHFLVQLNGQYEGQATGETFNGNGRTDILVRSGDRNVFIAECKIWEGPKSVTTAIDQILGYATWRDTKLALLIFNKNDRFSDAVAQIPSVVEKHPCFRRRDRQYQSETGSRFVLLRPEDPRHEMILTVLVFDISHGSVSRDVHRRDQICDDSAKS